MLTCSSDVISSSSPSFQSMLRDTSRIAWVVLGVSATSSAPAPMNDATRARAAASRCACSALTDGTEW